MGGYPAMTPTAFRDKSAVGVTRLWCLVLTTIRTAAVPRFLLAKINNHIKANSIPPVPTVLHKTSALSFSVPKTSPPIKYLTIDLTKKWCMVKRCGTTHRITSWSPICNATNIHRSAVENMRKIDVSRPFCDATRRIFIALQFGQREVNLGIVMHLFCIQKKRKKLCGCATAQSHGTQHSSQPKRVNRHIELYIEPAKLW